MPPPPFFLSVDVVVKIHSPTSRLSKAALYNDIQVCDDDSRRLQSPVLLSCLVLRVDVEHQPKLLLCVLLGRSNRRYGLWSDTKQDYDRCTATFRETPALEPSWNHART